MLACLKVSIHISLLLQLYGLMVNKNRTIAIRDSFIANEHQKLNIFERKVCIQNIKSIPIISYVR